VVVDLAYQPGQLAGLDHLDTSRAQQFGAAAWREDGRLAQREDDPADARGERPGPVLTAGRTGR
jgi:hypothetical protein